MSAEHQGEVRCARAEGIATVTLDRPAKLNACTQSMYRQFRAVFEDINGDPALRCVLLAGAGRRAFCVGSDIGEFRAALDDPDRQMAEARLGRTAVDALLACPHPVVAAIEGACLGGGLELAASCDLRIGGPSSWFALPVKSLGMFVELEDLEVLARTLGQGVLTDLLMTGRRLEASEAFQQGFLSRLVEDREVAPAARALAQEIAEGAPLAARWHKRALRRLSDPKAMPPEVYREALACYATADFAEGTRAFLEKRPPRFEGL